jgi:hypothetical protein
MAREGRRMRGTKKETYKYWSLTLTGFCRLSDLRRWSLYIMLLYKSCTRNRIVGKLDGHIPVDFQSATKNLSAAIC